MTECNVKISKYFHSSESCFLPKWMTYHKPSEEEKSNIIAMAQKLDLVADLFNRRVLVHCWIRPILNNPSSSWNGHDYNRAVGGAPKSYHRDGRAVDFHLVDMNCDEVRNQLLAKLEEWGLRMEDNPGSSWVHLDMGQLVSNRFFKP